MIATSVEAVLVERAADRADPAVHHVRRRDDVDAGLRRSVTRRAREQFERRVVVDVARRVEHAAVAVIGVFAVAQIGDQQHVRVRPI